MSFIDEFKKTYFGKLGDRAEGFMTIFKNVQPGSLVIETGCAREPGNWLGDGQSSVLFDCFAEVTDGRFISIDISQGNIDRAMSACIKRKAEFICGDSILTLYKLVRANAAELSNLGLLYLDSFDLNPGNPLPSATHHLCELAAAMPLLRSGTIVAVDDFAVPGSVPVLGGKGMLVDKFMDAINAEVLHQGYQKVWRLP